MRCFAISREVILCFSISSEIASIKKEESSTDFISVDSNCRCEHKLTLVRRRETIADLLGPEVPVVTKRY